MSPFNSLPQEDAMVEKIDGSVLGPYKAIFAGKTIIIPDEKADVEEGDTILRPLPNGKDERSIATEVTFFQKISSLGSHFQIKFKKGGSSKSQQPSSNNITIHGAQSVQIGDHNTQNIVNSIQSLVQQIESADALPAEKEEAKSLLGKLLSHPLITSILGAGVGAILG